MARSLARESAMRILYEYEMGGEGIEITIGDLMEVVLPDEDLAYVRGVVDGVMQKLDDVDAVIEQNAIGWKLERISKVDLSILRLALFEMLYREDIPVAVSINEALELSHVYSTDESSSFINGILGTVARSNA